jgi:predicted nucleic acid-binding protein
MKYLLDTNVISELMRPAPSPSVVEKLKAKGKRCGLGAPTLYELEHGVAILPDGARKRALAAGLAAFAGSMTVFPFDRAAARWLATANAKLRTARKLGSILDGQIAAVAMTRGRILVTRNTRDFEPYEGLALESWFD